MSDKWEDKGLAGGIVSHVLPYYEERSVKNKETGEYRKVYKSTNQSTGEAIEKGQFCDKD